MKKISTQIHADTRGEVDVDPSFTLFGGSTIFLFPHQFSQRVQTAHRRSSCLLHLFTRKTRWVHTMTKVGRDMSYFELCQTKQDDGSGTHVGGGCGDYAPPSLSSPREMNRSILFRIRFKLCLPPESVMPFHDGAPLLRKILGPPLLS